MMKKIKFIYRIVYFSVFFLMVFFGINLKAASLCVPDGLNQTVPKNPETTSKNCGPLPLGATRTIQQAEGRYMGLPLENTKIISTQNEIDANFNENDQQIVDKVISETMHSLNDDDSIDNKNNFGAEIPITINLKD